MLIIPKALPPCCQKGPASGLSFPELKELPKLETFYSALAELIRLEIICLLSTGEYCVCEIVESIGCTQPLISFHLSVLKKAGLIKDRKNGKWIYYSLNHNKLQNLLKKTLSIFKKRKGGKVIQLKCD